MRKAKLLQVIILGALLAGLCFYSKNIVSWSNRQPDLPKPHIETRGTTERTVVSEEKVRVEKNGGSDTDNTERLGKAGRYSAVQSADTEFSCSIKRTNTERQILPSVTYSPGEGVSIKMKDRAETIQVQRGTTLTPTDYQVLWRKKY